MTCNHGMDKIAMVGLLWKASLKQTSDEIKHVSIPCCN